MRAGLSTRAADPALLAVLVIEAARDISRELEVLPLVLAHRHEVRLVEQDVRRHQHGVVEQADARLVRVRVRVRFRVRVRVRVRVRG